MTIVPGGVKYPAVSEGRGRSRSRGRDRDRDRDPDRHRDRERERTPNTDAKKKKVFLSNLDKKLKVLTRVHLAGSECESSVSYIIILK